MTRWITFVVTSDGPVILEYGDYELPYSRQAFHEIERVEQEGAGVFASPSAISH